MKMAYRRTASGLCRENPATRECLLVDPDVGRETEAAWKLRFETLTTRRIHSRSSPRA
jgi:hypothetical protein